VGPEGSGASSWSEFAQVDRILFFNLPKGESGTCPVHVGDTDNVNIETQGFADKVEDLAIQAVAER
jgi:hypothetical protein